MPSPPAISSARTTGSLIDPQTLMGIRHLELRARVVVEGFWSGLHRSPFHGFSVEFTEYRQYTPGDDPRFVDWRVLARTDRTYIKRFEDETNLRCHFLVDQSRSMTYRSATVSKSDYAATLAATLAYFLHQQGDAVGLLTFDDQVRDYLPARHRTGHLRRLMQALERPAAGQSTNLAAPLQRIAEIVRKRGLLVLLSDFLVPIDRLESLLIPLLAAGHELVIFQILDPTEIQFEFREPAVFEDVESGRTLLLDPVAVRPAYLRQIEEHTAAVRRVCQRLGASHTRLSTGQPLELALLDFLRARRHRRRPVRRARQAPARPVP